MKEAGCCFGDSSRSAGACLCLPWTSLVQSVIVAVETFHLQFADWNQPAVLRLIFKPWCIQKHPKFSVQPAVQMYSTLDALKTAIYRSLASSDSHGVCKYLMSRVAYSWRHLASSACMNAVLCNELFLMCHVGWGVSSHEHSHQTRVFEEKNSHLCPDLLSVLF